ncbi:hypothetical protein GCM10011390_20890 [Aureimonas endophytica]|uniref:Uncharacterized protein n=1 Tax=Aureimonas endophytica TaxID=2027858 RepID=A0A916ZK28_9HYPH|nr:hypothetical protein [Aureimonas endophytica]GGE01868.1 hypothetical protein GCM10011390_20890 [Aureimonas endophytica]
MALDPARFPLVDAEILDGIMQPDVLLKIGPGSSAVLYMPTVNADRTWSGFSLAEVDQLLPAAIEAGATVIDARKCSEDDYRSLVICGPMVAVGPMKTWRITGERHALSSLPIADYALLYAAIGAIVHNMPAPTVELEGMAK